MKVSLGTFGEMFVYKPNLYFVVNISCILRKKKEELKKNKKKKVLASVVYCVALLLKHVCSCVADFDVSLWILGLRTAGRIQRPLSYAIWKPVSNQRDSPLLARPLLSVLLRHGT